MKAVTNEQMLNGNQQTTPQAPDADMGFRSFCIEKAIDFHKGSGGVYNSNLIETAKEIENYITGKQSEK